MQRKVVLVTGATGGLGSAVVKRLADDGFLCLAVFRDGRRFEALAAEVGEPDLVHGVEADFSDVASIESAAGVLSDYGTPWGLVHLAGGFVSGAAIETALESWDSMMEINLRSAFMALRAVGRQLQPRGGGRMVFVGSSAVVDRPSGMAAYTVSKCAMASLVEIAAMELSGSGVTVNVILPDALDTAAMRGAGLDVPLVPLDRVAGSVSWLLSDDAAGITGAKIVVRA